MSKMIAFDDEHDVYELMFELKRSGGLTIKGRIAMADILCINFDPADETYCVMNLDGPQEWVGIDTDKNVAIVKYLATRLGVKLPLQGVSAPQQEKTP